MRSLVTLICSLLWMKWTFVSGDTCGPLGFDATELLKPGYWYFNLNQTQCPPSPTATTCGAAPAVNASTDPYCRIYMDLCQTMSYQCSGSVCARYLNTVDLIADIGYSVPDPFQEGENQFDVSFVGEKLPCTGGMMESKVKIAFVCDKNGNWTVNNTGPHQGSQAPSPVSAVFDCDTCQYNLVFNYSGACFKLPPGETREKPISMGSVVLILFFPGVVLYFIVGILVNRMRGRTGKEAIPHVKFWEDLPELIMDGFVFTMSFLTCRQDEGKMNYDTM